MSAPPPPAALADLLAELGLDPARAALSRRPGRQRRAYLCLPSPDRPQLLVPLVPAAGDVVTERRSAAAAWPDAPRAWWPPDSCARASRCGCRSVGWWSTDPTLDDLARWITGDDPAHLVGCSAGPPRANRKPVLRVLAPRGGPPPTRSWEAAPSPASSSAREAAALRRWRAAQISGLRPPDVAQGRGVGRPGGAGDLAPGHRRGPAPAGPAPGGPDPGPVRPRRARRPPVARELGLRRPIGRAVPRAGSRWAPGCCPWSVTAACQWARRTGTGRRGTWPWTATSWRSGTGSATPTTSPPGWTSSTSRPPWSRWTAGSPGSDPLPRPAPRPAGATAASTPRRAGCCSPLYLYAIGRRYAADLALHHADRARRRLDWVTGCCDRQVATLSEGARP